MPRIVVPAEYSFDAAGKPFSNAFDDVYHSADGAIGQARHVFLNGNDLPRRWTGRRHFAVLETGFGFGVNFIATWHAWRNDPQRCEFLHFVSIEKHPVQASAFTGAEVIYAELAEQARELGARWPQCLPGLQHVEFEGGRVKLTLAFGDIRELLPGLRLQADAIYLDGFAPDRNADMWSPDVLQHVARKAAAGATVATWSAANAVRQGLERAGFKVESRPGFASKREMTTGTFAPRGNRATQARPQWPERKAAIIGAGLAGAAVAERLASRGWKVHLIERHQEVAAEASGNLGGVFHPLISRDDNRLSQLTRAAFLMALERWGALGRAGHEFSWGQCGVLQMPRPEGHVDEAAMAEMIAGLAVPASYARYVDQTEAQRISGARVPHGGLFFPQGGWAHPASLVRASLEACGELLELHMGCGVASVERRDGRWTVSEDSGAVIASAPVVIYAGGAADTAMPWQQQLSTERLRGTVTYLPESLVAGPRVVVQGDGFVLPALDGHVVVGATFERPGEAVDGHAHNLAKLNWHLGIQVLVPATRLEGRSSFRAVTFDRHPIVGALDEGLYCALGYGSRGLVWSALAAEHLAALIEGEPHMLERDLSAAIDPARFARRTRPLVGSTL